MQSKNNQYSLDWIVNAVSGIGTSKDKDSYNEFGFKRLTDSEAINIYRGSWIGARVVDIHVHEALREWRTFTMQDDTSISQAMYDAEKKYKIKEAFKNACTYSIVFGGAAMLINIEGTGDLSTPLRLDSIKKGALKWVSVIDKRRIHPLLSPDVYYPNSPNFLSPEFYTTSIGGGESAYRIHKSRLIVFKGVELPIEEMSQNNFWGDSIYNRMFKVISNAEVTLQAISSLIHKGSVDIWKIKDLQGNLEKRNGESHIAKRITLNNMLMSIVNSIVIDKENEEIERSTASFGTLDKIARDFLLYCCSAYGIPETKFLGTSSQGLNATGEGDIRNFYDFIRTYQEDNLRLKLEYLDKIIAMSTFGSMPCDITFDFNSLWQENKKEIAEIEVIKSQRDMNYMNAGVMTAENIARELIHEETYQSLTEEDAAALADYNVNNYLEELEYAKNISAQEKTSTESN